MRRCCSDNRLPTRLSILGLYNKLVKHDIGYRPESRLQRELRRADPMSSIKSGRKHLLIADEEVPSKEEVQAKQPLVQSAPVASATSATAAPTSTRAPLANAADTRIKRTIAMQEATNSLHMKFTMVTGTHVLFSISDTRVDDLCCIRQQHQL